MNQFYYLTFLSPLSSIEKLTLGAILLISFILFIDFINTSFKSYRNSKMLEKYLYIKNNKWDDVVELLTNPKNIKAADIHNRIQIDISKFNSRYKDLLYHELRKVKLNKNLNRLNLQMFINILYNKKGD